MRKSLATDPKVVRISSALKADRFRTIGGLFSAWCLLDEHTETGKLEGYTPEFFDEFIGLPGLARAMESVGWLEIGEDFVEAKRFEEHNGATARRRAQDSVRKESARSSAKSPHAKRTKCGPEKRREEKREEVGECLPFSSQEFIQCWKDWKDFRKQIKKPMSEMTQRGQLDEFLKHGEAVSIAAMRMSIRSGWQGLFFDKITASDIRSSLSNDPDAGWTPDFPGQLPPSKRKP